MGARALLALLIAVGLKAGLAEVNPTMVPPGTSSLTFVFDITGSMFDDLEQVRQGAKKIYETVLTQRQRLIYNYVLVPFHDPDLGEIIDTTDALYFQRQLGKVHVYGGGDCPEMTLTGIKKALEISLPSSFIYVFTDARSKDHHLEPQVLNLIQEKQSSVVFVMTGDCGNRTHPGFRTYEKIAAASFGQVFHLQKSDVSTVLEYVRHSVQQKKVHLSYEMRDRGGTTVRKIPVDQHMTELTLSLSGDKDDEDFLEIQIRNPLGQLIDKYTYSKEGGTIDLKNVKLIRLKKPMPGNWQITTNSRLRHTLRVFGHGAIDFKYGFGAKPLETIDLARPRPVEGQTTYLMVNMTGLLPPGTPIDISLIDYYGHPLYTQPANPSKTNPNLYFVGPFVPPKGLFFVQVKGVDDTDYEFQRIAPTAIGSVSVGGPRAYMAQITTGYINKPVNLTCTVESSTPYSLRWRHGDEYLGPPLFYSESDTSVWRIREVTQKERGDYSCEVSSPHGNHTARTYLETREPPPHIASMSNVTTSMNQPAFFHCRTQSVTPAEIRWYRYGQPIGRNTNTMVYPNGTLVIWRPAKTDVGTYECRARNGGGTSIEKTFLNVYETPNVQTSPQRLYFALQKPFNISCRASGDPPLQVIWAKNGRKIDNDYNRYIGINNDLLVRSATTADAGTYECRAQNPAGSAIGYVDLRVSKELVTQGDYVDLTCTVYDGTPAPTITWFFGYNQLYGQKPEKMEFAGTTLRIKQVQPEDAGQYQCVAENMAGRAAAQATVKVGSPPSIIPSAEVVRVNIEKQVTLPCRVLGHPKPKITWSVDAHDDAVFTCSATNDYGTVRRDTQVLVLGLVAPVLGHVPPEEQIVEGHDFRLSCIIVLGTPRPDIQWFKNGQALFPTEKMIVEGGGTGLLIRDASAADEGNYRCEAKNQAGTANINVAVNLIKKPRVRLPDASTDDEGSELLEAPPLHIREGDMVDLPCHIDGKPTPIITWSLDGRPITSNTAEYQILPNNTLRVHKTDRATSGRFVCSAVNTAGQAKQVTQLNVVAPPTIMPGQTSYNFVEGYTLEIPCRVSGEPTPEIKWYMNDELVTDAWVDEDGTLHIDDANDIKGKLRCEATNSLGTEHLDVDVMVHLMPKILGSDRHHFFEAKLNHSINLPCPADTNPPPNRVWEFDGERILDGDDFFGSSVQINTDGSLFIGHVSPEHVGRFTCHVSNLAGDDKLEYDLKVTSPPKIVSDTPGVLDVIQGLTLEIPCQAQGKPQPTITWDKDGFQVIPNDIVIVDRSGTLRIHNTKYEHRGDYTCTASNSAGNDQRKTHVIVQEAPIIHNQTLTGYTAVSGDKVELRCLVGGSPTPIITWHKKGVQIQDTPGTYVTPDGILVLENAEKGDDAYYTCKATNAAGVAEKVIRLEVIAPPEIPDQDTVTTEVVRIDNPFSLYCPVFATPLPTISWELNDLSLEQADPNIQFSDDKRRLHVEKARITDAGVYKCIARNVAGESSKSFDVEVIVPINIDESVWKRKETVLEGGRIELGCPVTGLPKPTINWIVNGRIFGKEDPIDHRQRDGGAYRTV
ncbi:unnamed protein product, partial [Mesorhabditis spiculigera]